MIFFHTIMYVRVRVLTNSCQNYSRTPHCTTVGRRLDGAHAHVVSCQIDYSGGLLPVGVPFCDANDGSWELASLSVTAVPFETSHGKAYSLLKRAWEIYNRRIMCKKIE